MLGKLVKATFPRSDSRSKCVLELIHSDICGQLSTRYLRGYECFVTFIDDSSKKKYTYFLKTRDELFCHIQEFKARMENMVGIKIKVFCKDNRGKYAFLRSGCP